MQKSLEQEAFQTLFFRFSSTTGNDDLLTKSNFFDMTDVGPTLLFFDILIWRKWAPIKGVVQA